MLKYTAQLSQQFRRASSLSSLQTYHRIKSHPIKIDSLTNQKLNQTTPIHHHHNNNYNERNQINDKKQIDYCLNHNWKINQASNTRRTMSNAKSNCKKVQAWPTGQRRRGISEAHFNISDLLNQHNKTSLTIKQQQSQNPRTNVQTIPKYQQPLQSSHKINYDNPKQPNKQNNKFQSIIPKSNTINISSINNNCHKYHFKNNHKMGVGKRISCINNLQNIEKRIRATLGLQTNS